MLKTLAHYRLVHFHFGHTDCQSQRDPTVQSNFFKMNYLAYLLLALLLAHSVGPTGRKPVPEKVQKLFNIVQSHLGTCPKGGKYSFYSHCPSHLWPEILYSFVPMTKSLGRWAIQRLGVSAVFWSYLASAVQDLKVKYDVQELGKLRDEVIAWTLLNRYLKFERSHHKKTIDCLTSTLNALTDMELQQVSKLPYNVNYDLFDEINEIVNDPKKARLLDGLKRASRNGFEMSNMLVSLRRWLSDSMKGSWYDISFAPFREDLKGIPTEQLNAEAISVPNFQRDPELVGVFSIIFSIGLLDKLDTDKSFLQDSLPQSLPDRDHVISILTRLDEETRGNRDCRCDIESALRPSQDPKGWDETLAHNECVMRGLSKLPDVFFEEYVGLKRKERDVLERMIYNSCSFVMFLD